MKRNFFLFCLLIYSLMLSLHGGCQKGAQVQGQLKPAPEIKFDKVVIDFGKVGPESKSIDEVKFTNTGDDVLKIINIKQCCGVATALEKVEYAPGEKGVLKVMYNATTQTGPFKGQVIVSSNHRTDPNTTLTIKADVESKITCKPDKLKLFLDEENAACPKLTITSLDDKPFSIMAIRSTADCITAEYDPSAKAAEFVLELIVDMEKIQKNRRGSIDFIFTHPEGKAGSVNFNVVSKYSLDPQMLLRYDAKENVPISTTIKVLTNYNKDFEIESTTSRDNTIQVIGNSKIENGYRLDIEITPPAKEGKIRFSDVLYINIKGGQKLSVTCTGYYVRG